MPTVRDVALGLAGVCTTVPPIGDGVCARCHSCPGPGWSTCWSCDQAERQVSRPCGLVVPISLYEIPSQLHHILRHYKSGSYPQTAPTFTMQVAAILGHFLALHGECIESAAGGGWDIITSVPSSKARPGDHPLTTAIRMLPKLRDTFEPLLQRGTVDVGHNVASDQGFALARPLGGERVLIVDDTLTSGARAQSAASAINNGGGEVVAIVAVGRVINPGFAENVKEYWDRLHRRPFSFDVCCLE